MPARRPTRPWGSAPPAAVAAALLVAAALGSLLGGCAAGDGGPGDAARAAASLSSPTGSSGPARESSPAPGPTGPLAGRSAGEVYAAARAATAAATSVRLVGSVTSGGRRTGIDVVYAGARGARGTVTVAGAPLRILRVGRDVYISGTPQFWRAAGAPRVGAVVGSKYLRAAVGDPQWQQLADFTELGRIFDTVLRPSGNLEVVPGRVVDGTATIGLRDTGTPAGDVLYVADTATPYPLLLRYGALPSALPTLSSPAPSLGGPSTPVPFATPSPTATGPGAGNDPLLAIPTGEVRFGGWGAPVTLARPPAALVLDASRLR